MSHSHGFNVTTHRAFAIGISLNVAFVLVEFYYGMVANSLALIADAGHNLSDVLGLLLAWGAILLATKANTDKRTYGYRKGTVLAALLSGILLMAALGVIAWEAWQRFFEPQPIVGMTMILVAAMGVLINAVTALLFFKSQANDLNIKGAFLHMSADAAVSMGVVISGVFVLWFNVVWIDPAISLVIVLVVFLSAWGLLRDSFNYAMDAVPNGINTAQVRDYLLGLNSVISVQDLHIWPLSTSLNALSVHLVVSNERIDNELLAQIKDHMHTHFLIEHITVQVETTARNNG
ncbi:cation diffusion facilitator family transporter [Thiomicrorhabdus aquaedulcis]|uniref:cation diffusion facilitator family transporter n=1 Tax=Thiomicrorhabdus aquaedulcis TaxID=2211106 RepID=UPI000FD77976|nr:cation diffusion facilitator family transporter [Thiomicrorhabdus aquaedulcis]